MAPAREKYYATMIKHADAEFKDHRIVAAEGGRWLVQRPDDNAYWFEAISLRGGALFVGGDIDFVVFGFYSDPNPTAEATHEAKLRWMGESNDITHYVVQKANIGMGSEAVVYARDRDVAREDLMTALEQHSDALGPLSIDAIDKALGLVEDEDYDAAERELAEHGLYEYVSWPVGRVVSGRVIMAWRALRALCREIDRAKVKASMEVVR